MITRSEYLEFRIDELKEKSNKLKEKHKWGMWDNWRSFTSLDIEINDLKMELLKEENKHLKEAFNDYKDYTDE